MTGRSRLSVGRPVRTCDNRNMRRQEVAEQHGRIERELTEERAAALLRISRTLESLIDQLHAARKRLPALAGPERQREVSVYHDLRRRAVKYRWYLEVQREALGLRHHHGLDEFYAIPGPIDG